MFCSSRLAITSLRLDKKRNNTKVSSHSKTISLIAILTLHRRFAPCFSAYWQVWVHLSSFASSMAVHPVPQTMCYCCHPKHLHWKMVIVLFQLSSDSTRIASMLSIHAQGRAQISVSCQSGWKRHLIGSSGLVAAMRHFDWGGSWWCLLLRWLISYKHHVVPKTERFPLFFA